MFWLKIHSSLLSLCLVLHLYSSFKLKKLQSNLTGPCIWEERALWSSGDWSVFFHVVRMMSTQGPSLRFFFFCSLSTCPSLHPLAFFLLALTH